MKISKKCVLIVIFIIHMVLFWSLISLQLMSSVKTVKAYTGDLDYIHEYFIWVNPRKDGTLDVKIECEWEVLNSSTDGPLTWIKIGVPNCYVDEFKKQTSNISELSYYHENGESTIRIDLNRSYYQGEKLRFIFSFHLSRMYHLDNDMCYYDYSPGYFSEIRIGNMKVYWNKKDVVDANTTFTNNNYIEWEANDLYYNETIGVKVSYKQSSFINLDEKLQYSDHYMPKREKIIIAIVVTICIAIIITSLIFAYLKKDPYMSHRGFIRVRWYRPYYRYHPNTGVNKKGRVIVNPATYSSGGHSSGGSCACACACACAGGGRAGCSRKDFYNTNIKSDQIIKQLDN